MVNKSIHTIHKTILTGLTVFLVFLGSPMLCDTAHGAEPLIVPADAGLGSAPSSTGHNRGVVNTGPLQAAKGHILVELHPNADESMFLQSANGLGLRTKSRIYGSKWLIMSIPKGTQPRQAAASARALPGVRRATEDLIIQINDLVPPQDPMYIDDDDPTTKDCDPLIDFCDSWDLVDQWGLFKMEAELGWENQTGSSDVVIAIIDSGVDLDHDDLWENIWQNRKEIEGASGVDDDVNGFVDDKYGYDFVGANPGGLNDDPTLEDANPDIPMGGDWVTDTTTYPFGWGIHFEGDPAVGDALDNNGDGVPDLGVFHGTFVAGIAGAMTNNTIDGTTDFEGMAGVCWHCKLMALRVINAEGWAFGSDAVAAINYAADNGADVINISWGIKIDPSDQAAMDEIQILAEAIDNAVSRGVIVVAAAGNSGTEDLHFPASMANTIAVGSSNWLDRRSDFSSFANLDEIPDNGVDDDGNGWVDDVLDVVAPGELIWSTAVMSAYDSLLYELLGMPGWEPGLNVYSLADGTSFSTPLVSGYVGLILSQEPEATLSQVREVIRSNAVDILNPNGTGASLVGYDAYTGFGRVTMVVPLAAAPPSPSNEQPVAEAGGDQTVQDKAKPGVEEVTLDGSQSSGNIVSYQWFAENGTDQNLIATGMIATLDLPVGSNMITLQVTDDKGENAVDQVVIEILPKNGDQTGDTPGNGTPKGSGNGNGKKPTKN